MFDKYGEFDSAEEINEAAKAKLEEGDLNAVLEIALENGIDKEDAEDFIDGAVGELATPLMAALGKISMEEQDLKPYEIMEDWLGYIRMQCQDNTDMCRAVRKKGKSLKKCIAELLKWSLKNQYKVPKEILEECKISYECTLGIPGMKRAKDIIKDYYMK